MINPGPHRLEKTRAILTTSGSMELKEVTPNFFQELVAEHKKDGCSLISTFAFDSPWGVWEMHPEGDEFVYLLSGDTDFTLHDGEREIAKVRIATPGEYLMVPQGCWHTAHPHMPTRMLFVTPGDGTVNANTPGGEPI